MTATREPEVWVAEPAPAAAPHPPAMASDRIRRALFLASGIVGAVFNVSGSARTLDQAELLQPAWFALTVTLLWAIPVVLIIAAVWAPMRWVRAVAIAYVAAYCIALLGWVPFMAVDRITDGTFPWITGVLSAPVFCAASLWGERLAWSWMIALNLATGVVRFLADGGSSISGALLNTLYNTMSLTIFVAVIMVVARGGRERDRAAAALAVDAAATAATEAQRVQRARVAALAHDDVISALRGAAEATPATSDALRDHALRTLQRLDSLALEDRTPLESMTAPEFIATLRASVDAVAAGIRFEAPRYPTGDVPRDVAKALVDAATEGVRNSVRHAQPRPGSASVTRGVRVAMSGQSVSVIVTDDGAGFDSGQASSDGDGIRLGIHQRLAEVAGAHGNVNSSPQGTRVALTWVQPTKGQR